jgi:hypothetical protein
MAPYECSKDDLNKMPMDKLRKVATNINKTKTGRIDRVSDYKADRRSELADIIWEIWGGDIGWEKHIPSIPNPETTDSPYQSTEQTPSSSAEVPIQSDTPPETPQSDIVRMPPPKKSTPRTDTPSGPPQTDTPPGLPPSPQTDTPSGLPQTDTPSGLPPRIQAQKASPQTYTPPGLPPGVPPRIQARTPSPQTYTPPGLPPGVGLKYGFTTIQDPPPLPQKRKEKKVIIPKVEFNFNDSDLMTEFTVNLKTYTPGDPELPDSDDIGVDELLELVKKDDFCIKVANSLKDIYIAKLKKYVNLQEKTMQSIKNDNHEKMEMQITAKIDKQDLDRLFPMIIINTAFLTKLKVLTSLAEKKLKQFISPTSQAVIKLVREKLMLSITDEDDGIVSVTGASRVHIRNQLCKMIYILSKGYRPFMDAFLNLVFTGPAGVGKTKLAKTYAFVFENSGILLRGDLIIASPKDMVGEYVGHTAIKSAGVLMKALEGVILIDEAYQIMPCKAGKLDNDSKSFGPEAITEIVNFLDKYMGMSIMIVAGYQKEMENCFFAANEGLSRRFPNRVSIPSYSTNDLLNIFINGVNSKIEKDIFNSDISRYIYTLIVKLSQKDPNIFANQAGDMMNLASMFLNSYYGSVKSIWGKSFEDDILIANSAINQFLRNKGYSLIVE